MIKFSIGLVGLILLSGAHDTVDLILLAAAAVPCGVLMVAAIADIAE